MKPIIVIPARLASTRLPNKPLADIAGKPMIVHVMERAEESGVGPVYVACAEAKIANAVIAAGGKAVLTDPNHPSGTDRINEALSKIPDNEQFDVVVNLQGDLPTLDPQIVKDILKPLQQLDVDISTLAVQIDDEEEKSNPNVVKAIADFSKGDVVVADDFTRNPPEGLNPLYHHIGIYGFKREALERFTSLPQSIREKQEKLEQLRALDNGIKIGITAVKSVPFGVDTKEDLEKARVIIGAKC
jgi:3-deoxy-manno-octulosonate cytidylyltransferase (CMP-KDO synthetase)